MWKKLFGSQEKPLKKEETSTKAASNFEEAITEKIQVIQNKYPIVDESNFEVVKREVIAASLQTIATHGFPPPSEESIKESENRNKFVFEKSQMLSSKRDESAHYAKEFRKTKQQYNKDYAFHIIREYIYREACVLLSIPLSSSFFYSMRICLEGEYSLFENTIFKKKFSNLINKDEAIIVERELYNFCYKELPELMQVPKLPSGEFITLLNCQTLDPETNLEIRKAYDLLPFQFCPLIEKKAMQWAERIA